MSVYCLKNCGQILTLEGAHKKDGRHLIPDDLSIIENGAIVCDEQTILWVGKEKDLPSDLANIPSKDLNGLIVTPGLIDSHTHLVFAGNRAKEYGQRLNGDSYQNIAKNGGGILSTVKETSKLTRSELVDLGKKRIEELLRFGLTAVEIKSGYCLDFDKELELSLAIDDLKKFYKDRIQIFNTYMAAHAVPSKFSSAKEYLRAEVIPLFHKLADFKVIDAIDIFFEQGYFDRDDTVLFLDEVKKRNIPIKMHADEFQDNKGALLACQYNALSADHLLKTQSDGISMLAKSSTVATILPGTSLFLGKDFAPVKEMLNAGVKVALASDFNPGSCHFNNLLFLSSIVAAKLEMNVAQIWSAITLNAAHALGFSDQGAVIVGHKPRFSFFRASCFEEILYDWGKNRAIMPL